MKPSNSTSACENATVPGDQLDIGRCRVFRQVVAIEVFWLVEPGESEFRDWEGVARGAISMEDPPPICGIGVAGEVEELLPGRQEPGA